MGEWSNGLFGCFNNCGLCIITYFVPCYTHGKTAEAVEGSCVLCGLSLLVPLLNIYAICSTRGKVREQKGIDGSAFGDLIATLCCGLCVVVQSAQEVGVSIGGAGESMSRE